MTKICTSCDKEKPLKVFRPYPKKNGTTGYRKICSACRSKKYRSKKENKIRCQKILKRAKNKYNKNKLAMKMSLLEHINQTCCQHCGETNPIVLCFHHIDPKQKSYSIKWAMTHSYSLETIKKEAEKCQVLCANCHTIHHYLGQNCKRSEHRCRATRVLKLKAQLMEDIGQSQCKICNCSQALSFHHRNPATKNFILSDGMNKNMAYEKLLEEAKKCDILCMNCHFVHHAEIKSWSQF